MKTTNILVAIIAALISWSTSVVASGAQFIITGYFEDKSIPGKFKYKDSVDGAGLLINYYSPSLKKTLTYYVAKFDECSAMAMYQIPYTRQVAVDGSCSSQGGQIYKYVYEWSSINKNWCLIREITGEKSDISLGTVRSSEQVSRVKNCAIFGITSPYSYESAAEIARDISAELKQFRIAAGGRETLKKYLGSLPSYSVSELKNYINKNNVQDINNLAFYLSQNGRSYDAIPLLERIVTHFPRRVVTKLNLADAYWDSHYEEQGAAVYKQYYDEMALMNLKENIPVRVISRMKKP